MHFILPLTSLLTLTSALVLVDRTPAKLSGPQAGKLIARSGVCGPLQTPLCCQLDVSGVANLNCENAAGVKTTEAFQATCAETGRTAECCVLAVGADGLLCTAA
ncbi:fungal hydrophobin-domain-containing protein [Dendryphion nanum]|uniref:Fungal hydrophobin-domain-containing protein n=1 Tax=Dendryphion nanum TaxID=256645 RepID=A0A9P9EFZ4_9PLEO|nr:fungal hydrophobin-domain-containing protein [Dendryphion nanum]